MGDNAGEGGGRVEVRLPGAVIGAAMTVTCTTLLGPTWGRRLAAAVATLRSGRLRCQVAIFCWTFPWLFSKLLSGGLVPRRMQPPLRA